MEKYNTDVNIVSISILLYVSFVTNNTYFSAHVYSNPHRKTSNFDM